jgi:hypothetical protein
MRLPPRFAGLAAVSAHTLLLSVVVFLVLGVAMNGGGHLLHIAWFKNWWQVVPCYLGYVLPLALLLRSVPSGWERWRLSVLAFIPLELVGYAIGSSVIADGNVIAAVVGPHNFTLAMVLLVSPTPLLGNSIVDFVERLRAPPGSTP